MRYCQENKKECALAHSRAEARLPRQPSTLAPSAHPRGVFLSYGNEVSYTTKKPCVRHSIFRCLPKHTAFLFMTIECSRSVHSIVAAAG